MNYSFVFILGAIPVLYLLLRFPVVTFFLFVNAGVYKADPRLSFLTNYFDLTLMFGIVTVLGVIHNLVQKRTALIIPSKKAFFPFLTIALLAGFSLLYTNSIIYGLDKFVRFVTITALSLFLPWFVFQRTKALQFFLTAFIIFSLLMINEVLRNGVVPGSMSFNNAFESNYLAMGRMVGSGVLVVLFYFYLYSKNKIVKFCSLLLTPFMIFGVLITGGRGPIIALILSTIATICMLGIDIFKKGQIVRFKIKKIHLRLFLLIVLIIIIVAILLVCFNQYFSDLLYRLELLQGLRGNSALGRIERFQKAWEVISNFPNNIFGLGIGGFNGYYANLDEKRGDYPHNIFLEFGSELGIVGLIIFCYFIFYALFESINGIKQNADLKKQSFYTVSFSLLIFMLINVLVSGDINDNRMLFTWIGVVYSIRNIKG